MSKKIVGKILTWILLIIMVPILVINLTMMFKTFISKEEVPSIFGFKPMIVASGSMEPTIMTGDLIIDKNYNGEVLSVNDIITFKDGFSSIVTHRIVQVDEVDGEVRYYTKGDNNSAIDQEYIVASNIEGVYLMRIAKFGFVLSFFQTRIGMICLVSFVFIMCFIITLLNKSDKNNDDIVRNAN